MKRGQDTRYTRTSRLLDQLGRVVENLLLILRQRISPTLPTHLHMDFSELPLTRSKKAIQSYVLIFLQLSSSGTHFSMGFKQDWMWNDSGESFVEGKKLTSPHFHFSSCSCSGTNKCYCLILE